jgi:hypothetical protein
MKQLLFILLTTIPFFCCGQNLKIPFVIDYLNQKGKLKPPTREQNEVFNIRYIGKYSDSILIGNNRDIKDEIENHSVYITVKNKNHYSSYMYNKFDIIVDTLKQITFTEYDWVKNKIVTKYYKSHSIIIYNNSDTISTVGYGLHVPIILEAIDTLGNWKPVEISFMYTCGVGLKDVVLKPKEMLCALAPIYQGDFETRLRYNLGNNYSNEFYGKISKGQFILKRTKRVI